LRFESFLPLNYNSAVTKHAYSHACMLCAFLVGVHCFTYFFRDLLKNFVF